jgi:hypothetical protein
MQRLLSVTVLATVTIGGFCGLPFYWLKHQWMQDNPPSVYRYYQAELDRYAQRLQTGAVRYVEGRGYGIPQFLIDHGARYVVKKGDCYVVIFGFMPTDAVPELWFSPDGFDPIPAELASVKNGKGYFHWKQLSAHWGACHWDQ